MKKSLLAVLCFTLAVLIAAAIGPALLARAADTGQGESRSVQAPLLTPTLSPTATISPTATTCVGCSPTATPVRSLLYLAVLVRSEATPQGEPTTTPEPGVVTGTITIEDGSCCAGGIVGEPIAIDVEFSATSAVTDVTEMRTGTAYGGGCATAETNLAASEWVTFTENVTYTVNPVVNWVGFYVAAQFRDAAGNVSPVYCEDISVEGMPAPRTPTPTITGTSRPDLVALSHYVRMRGQGDSSCVEEYDALLLYVCLSNSGNADASAFDIAVNGMVRARPSGWQAGYYSCVEAGLYDYTVHGSSPVTMTVDSADEILEIDEENNNLIYQMLPIPTPPPLCSYLTPTAPAGGGTPTPTPTIGEVTSTPTLPGDQTPAATPSGEATWTPTPAAGDGTPSPTPTHTPTPAICEAGPPPTPEPLWVEPVTSPTGILTQTIQVRLGRGSEVTVLGGVEPVTVMGMFSTANTAEVTIELIPNTTHQLTVEGTVEYAPDCFYTLRTGHDRYGNPLTIVQQSGKALRNQLLRFGNRR